jgi:very-short-patch-repair endonuclease
MRNAKAVRRSRELRREMTPFERKLWYHLNQRQMGGIKFRRQAAVGPFIVDFLSHDATLVIEIDGDTHDESAAEYDACRSAYFAPQGLRVLRLWNVELAENLEGVIERFARNAVSVTDA